MTTRDQQIAEAVIEAAAKKCDEFGQVATAMPVMALQAAAKAIRALDRDAILASVPKQEVEQSTDSKENAAEFLRMHDGLNVIKDGTFAHMIAVSALQDALDRLRKAEVTAMRQAVMVQLLLDHCKEPECHTCAEIICPHNEPLHFHHDGCPACYERAAPDSADSAKEK